MSTFIRIAKLLATGAVLAWIPVAGAQTPLPLTGDLPYQSVGRIDYIDVGSGKIVVSDGGYQLAPNVLVHNADGKLVTPGVLAKGMRIGATTRIDGRRTVITEIWIVTGH